MGAMARAKAKVVKISLKTDRVSCNGATKVSQRIDSVLCYFSKLLTCLLHLTKKKAALSGSLSDDILIYNLINFR